MGEEQGLRTMPTSDTQGKCAYSQEEVQHILNLAIAQQASQGEFSRQQLLEIAAELGLSKGAIAAAEQAWQQQQGDLQKRETFNAMRQADLRKHAGQYVIVVAGLVLLNVVMGASHPWSLVVLVPCGLKLALEAWNVYYTQGEAYEKAFHQWQRNHQVRHLVKGWLGRFLNA